MKPTAELITDLPRPIALLLLRCVDEVTDSGKSAVDLFEVLTRYLSAVTVALYCTTKGSAEVDRICLATETSTGLGKGCDRLLAAAKGLRRSGVVEFRPFWEWIIDSNERLTPTGERLREMIQQRNNFIHRPSENSQLISSVISLVEKIGWLTSTQMFVVLDQGPVDRQINQGTVRWLNGSGAMPSNELLRWSGELRLVSRVVYLVLPDGKMACGLSPFLLWDSDKLLSRDSIFLWTKVTRSRVQLLSAFSTTELLFTPESGKSRGWKAFIESRPHSIVRSQDWLFEAAYSEEDSDSAEVEEQSVQHSNRALNFLIGFVMFCVILLGLEASVFDWGKSSTNSVTPSIGESTETWDPSIRELTIIWRRQPPSELELWLTRPLPDDAGESSSVLSTVIDFHGTVPTQVKLIPNATLGGVDCVLEPGTFEVDVGTDKYVLELDWRCAGAIYQDTVELGPGSYEVNGRAVLVKTGLSIGRTEVTLGMWSSVYEENAACVDCPVANKSWRQVTAFADKLSEQEGLQPCYSQTAHSGCNGWRLPTETEWELIARSGGSNQPFSGSQNPYSVGVVDQAKAAKVATKQASRLGTFDMTGNLLEWCHNEPLDVSVEVIEGSAPYKALRGGSYLDTDHKLLELSHRRQAGIDVRRSDIGFRLLRGD